MAAVQAVLPAAPLEPGHSAAPPCRWEQRGRARHNHRAARAGQQLPDALCPFAGCAQFQERHHQGPAAPAGPGLQGEGRGCGGSWAVAAARGVQTGPSALVLQAHNDMLQTFQAKLTDFGIPLDNLGFKPLASPVLGQALGQGPAGLVAVPT